MNLFVRLLWVLLWSHFKPRTAMSEAIELEMRVLPNDLDLNIHMTNARFLGVLDLALLQLVVRSGFFRVIRALRAWPIAGGTLITFRAELPPLSRYRVRIWHLGSTDFWHVFGFAFIRADGRVAAKGLVKGAAVRKRQGLVACSEIWALFSRQTGRPVQLPALPDYALEWLASERRMFEMPIRGLARPATPSKAVRVPESAREAEREASEQP